MARRQRRRKENWGEDSDDDVDDASRPRVGLDGFLSGGGRGSKAALAMEFETGRGSRARDADAADEGGDMQAGSSGEEEGDDDDSDDDAATAEETRNTRERKKETQGRDQEKVAAARLRAQGLNVDEEGDEDGLQEEKESDHTDAKMTDVHSGAASATRELSHHEKMKLLFDRRKDEKMMRFVADDPLKPNADKRRAAMREDEELDEEEEARKDPWLAQAAEEEARRAKQQADEGEGVEQRFNTFGGKTKPLVASTAIFERDEAAPPFDQHAARLILLRHMQPGETVLKAVRRLGAVAPGAAAGGPKAATLVPQGSLLKTKMKNVRRKPRPGDQATAADNDATSSAGTLDPEAEKARKAAFDELTEAAQGFLSSGYVEIYQDTYEKIDRLVRAQQAHESLMAQRQAAASTAAASMPSASADARARAAARLQRKRDARAAGLPEPDSSSDEEDDIFAAPAAIASAAAAAASPAPPASLQWRYRWSADDDDVQGPFSAEKMAQWQAAGFFNADVVAQPILPYTPAQQQTWVKVTQVKDFMTGEIDRSGRAESSRGAAPPPAKKFKF